LRTLPGDRGNAFCVPFIPTDSELTSLTGEMLSSSTIQQAACVYGGINLVAKMQSKMKSNLNTDW